MRKSILMTQKIHGTAAHYKSNIKQGWRFPDFILEKKKRFILLF